MPQTMQVTPQDLADIVRDAIVSTFDELVSALQQAPDDLSAREAAERLLEGRAELEAKLIHNGEQVAAEQAARR